MTIRTLSGANDATTFELDSNDYHSTMTAAKAAAMAAAKAKKEAAERAAAEFEAKATEDARDLDSCRDKIRTLENQLQEAQGFASTSSAETASAISKADALQDTLASKTNELHAAKAEIQRLTTESSSKADELHAYKAETQRLTTESSRLERHTSDLTESIDRLKSEVRYYADRFESSIRRSDDLAAELTQRNSELDSGDVTVRQITWGNKDLTNDGEVGRKIKERVRNGWAIPFTNDFFGGDPQPGVRKWGTVRFCRSRKVEGWEYEEKPSMP